MSARDWLRAIAKEVRALAPTFAAIGVAMFTGATAPRGAVLQGIGVAAFLVGPSALGALSVGHEFNFGTWPLLLTLPVSRRRLLLTKWAVLVTLLLLLLAVEASLGVVGESRQFGRRMMFLPLALGAFVAPWLTLVTRRAVGGTAFAVALPGVLLILGQIAGAGLYGDTGNVDIVVTRLVFWGVSAACVAGAFLGPRRFMRLELMDGGSPREQAAARVRESDRPDTTTRLSPMWSLFLKELRLQRLTLALAVFYMVTYVIAALTNSPRLQVGAIIAVLTAVYGTSVAMVAGAVTSAEERQLGTLDAELLLPIAVRRQWTIKAATALGLALALGYGLPSVLFRILPIPIVRVEPLFGGVTALFAAISLYVSSVSRSTLSAVVLAFPVYAAIGAVFREIGDPVTRAAFTWLHGQNGRHPAFGPRAVTLVATSAALLTVFVVRLALSNHRYADRNATRIAAHAAMFVVALTVGLALLGAAGVL